VEQQNILGRYVGNLRSRIADLQKQGLTINHKMITVIKANGKKVFVAEYSMKAKVEQRHQLLNKPQLNLFA
jgi:hypothetical protein